MRRLSLVAAISAILAAAFSAQAPCAASALTVAQLTSLGVGAGSHTVWLEVTDAFGVSNRGYTRLDVH